MAWRGRWWPLRRAGAPSACDRAWSCRCRRLEIELGLELGDREPLTRILGCEANHDVAQLAHVAREVVALPAGRRRGVELEGLGARLQSHAAPEVLEQRELVRVHVAQR